jgi:crotonobetainyl-CoA:carnitine CoA-transferase CaiB-like acyl-CoA transferase
MISSGSRGVLDGIRILDFTWMLAGPYATRILADYGAEVIKVQSKKTAKGAESNLTESFAVWNRNKRSITLDLSHPEAREIALKLTGISDIVVESFSPRVMSNWGLTYDKMKQVNGDIIMVSISAMGPKGPWKDFVAYAPTFHALSGLSYLTSYSQEPPIGIGHAYADFIIGLYTAFSILAALEIRDRTGEGQRIELSGLEAMCCLMGPAHLQASVNKKEMIPTGNRTDYILAAPYGCYPCAGQDRWCVIAAFNEAEWGALCRIIGNPPWTRDERFSDFVKRKENEEDLDQLIAGWTVQYFPETVVRLLQEAGVPAGVVQNAEDMIRDPQLKARDFFVTREHPVLGNTLSGNSPMKFGEDLRKNWKASPLLGEDNSYVYRELLGLSEDELSSYIEKGIIG